MRLFLLLLMIATIEVILIAKVGNAIGFFNTFLIILVTAILGSWLLKKQWHLVMGKLQTLQGEEPSQALAEAFILLVCAIFLITPGFLTDIFGFLGLIPAVRERFAYFLRQHSQRFIIRDFQRHAQRSQHTQSNENHRHQRHSNVIDGEFERKD